MNYYYNLDLSKYTHDLIIKDLHLTKFKNFLYMILNTEEKSISLSKIQMESIFGAHFYKKIPKTLTTEVKMGQGWYYDDKVVSSGKYAKNSDETILFHRLFVRKYKGNNLVHKVNEYGLRLDVNQVQELQQQIEDNISNELSFKSFLKGDEDIKKTPKYYYSNIIEIDIDYLVDYIKENKEKYSFLSNSVITRDMLDFRHLTEIVGSCLSNKSNKVKVEYKREAAGRFTNSIGLNKVQGMKKSIRKELLHGYHEYDMSTASVNYFEQVYYRIMTDDSPLLEAYTQKYKKTLVKKKKKVDEDEKYLRLLGLKENNSLIDIDFYTSPRGKNSVRQWIADTIKTKSPVASLSDDESLGLAKEILTMLFFNAKTNQKVNTAEVLTHIDGVSDVETIEVHKTSLQKVLNEYQRQNFFGDPLVKSILIEIDILMGLISLYLQENNVVGTSKTTKMLKVNGRKTGFERYSKGKALSFMYQSWESEALIKMRDTYIKSKKDRSFVLIHDGIYTKMSIDKEEFVQAVLTATSDYTIRAKID